MFTRNRVIMSHNIKTPLTSISRAVGNILQLKYDQLIKSLFSNGEQGFAYDPNDLSTMFQDAAGTIPVTVVGQPVGLILDKSKGLSIGALHLTTTDVDFANSWTPTAAVISKTKYSFTTSAVGGCLRSIPNVLGKPVKLRIKGQCTVPLTVRNGGSLDGSITIPAGSFDIVSNNPAIFYASPFLYFYLNNAGTLTLELITIEDVAGNHAYQTTSASRPILRKNAVTGANYLEFDGSDDFLQTSNIDFTSTAKVSLFAGLVKNTSGTIGSIFEFSSNPLNNSGTFGAYTDINVSMRGYSVYSRGTAAVAASIQTSSMKASLVLMADISQDKITAQVNGVTSTTRLDQGTGNYGNYPLYIGRRGGAILPFNGHLYSLIGIGRLTTDSETIALEKAIAKNTGVTLNV